MCVRKLVLLLCGWGLASQVWGEQQTLEVPLQYAVDFRLAMYEAFRRPDATSEEPRPLLSNNSKNGYRSLGLRSAYFNVHWEDFHSSVLSLGFRPDALQFKPEIPADEPRDFDSRAGSVYRQKPVLALLQEYHMGAVWGEQASLAYGLWDRFPMPEETYADIVEFGLAAQVPRSFTGARIHLRRNLKDEFGVEQSHLSASAFVVQGREIRAEARTRHKRTFDVGPASENPYWGGAVTLNWIPKFFESALLAGYEERREYDGQVKEIYGQLIGRKAFSLFSQDFSTLLDIRTSSEQWLGTTIDYPELLQLSASLFLHWSHHYGWKIFAGIHWGSSDRWFEERSDFFVRQVFKGYQFDIGFVKELQKHLFASLVLSKERRYFDNGGDNRAAFDLGSNDDEIQRFGFELRYSI